MDSKIKSKLEEALNRDGNAVLEDDVILRNKEVFGDTKEHFYDIVCEDGCAKGYKSDLSGDIKYPSTINMTYPKREEIINDPERAKHVLEYRGLYDLTPKDITYGDIMMAYGVLSLPKTYTVWARVGMTLTLTEDEIVNNETLSISKLIEEGRAKVDGDSYIPENQWTDEEREALSSVGFDTNGDIDITTVE